MKIFIFPFIDGKKETLFVSFLTTRITLVAIKVEDLLETTRHGDMWDKKS